MPETSGGGPRGVHRATLEGEHLDFEFISLDAPIADAPRPRIRTTELAAGIEHPPRAVLIVQTPSLDHDRLWFHEQMLGILFHPHTQPPAVALLLSCTCDTSALGLRRYGYVTDEGVANQLRALVGEFAVLLLDAEGRILLRSSEGLHRHEIHEALHYREPPPGPRDHAPPPGPPTKKGKQGKTRR
jgi:hypothetical protein